MGLFDEPIMIDGKEVGYKLPEESELIDLEKLCPWLARPNQKKSKLGLRRSQPKFRPWILKIEMRVIIYNFVNRST